MNGYLRIKNTDLYERDGVTYWRNGGNIIGNVVKAVIEENDVVTSETYYIDSLKTAKPIMLDPDVKIGGLTASVSKNGNFIIVSTAPADFTEYGGCAGLKITFIYGVNYYSIETVEPNGDIKIYDPDGESGTITPDALPDTTDAVAGDVLTLDSDKKPTWKTSKLSRHMVSIALNGNTVLTFEIISVDSTYFTTENKLGTWLKNNNYRDISYLYGVSRNYVDEDGKLIEVYGIYGDSSNHVIYVYKEITYNDGVFVQSDYKTKRILSTSVTDNRKDA